MTEERVELESGLRYQSGKLARGRYPSSCRTQGGSDAGAEAAFVWMAGGDVITDVKENS